MAKSNVNHFSSFPYHITGRMANRNTFHLELPTVWDVMSDYLCMCHYIYGLRIHSFVLMPNHFHLIASLTTHSLPIVMNRFMSHTSLEMNRLTNRMNQNWGGPHFKCEIIGFHYFMNCYKYVYQNPVRANLCQRVQDWKFSTIHSLLGQSRATFPIIEDTILFENHRFSSKQLSWLNKPANPDDLTSMRRALKRKQFSLPKTIHQKANPLQNGLI